MIRAGVGAIVLLAVLAGAACGSTAGPAVPPSKTPPVSPITPSASPLAEAAGQREITPPKHGSVRVVRTLTTGLDVPWGMALMPGGKTLLVTTRDDAKVHRVDLATGHTWLVGRIPGVVSNVAEGGEAGLLGIALSPDFATDYRLYLYYSTAHDNRIAWTVFDEHRKSGHQLGALHVIKRGIPHGVHHNGGRIAFGPDGMLYAGTGESEVPSLAQNLHSLGGKVLRMTPAGKPAPGNPFKHSVVYSYGHRNVEGLAFDPDGRLWASEFGDRAYDELNLIKAGHDYGWPATQGRTKNPRYTSPVAQWGTEVDSPSGIAYAGGSIWMAALKGERLYRIPLNGAHVEAKPHAFLVGRFGRLRSVLALGPHTIVVSTSNRDGRTTPRAGDDKLIVLHVT